MQYQQKMRVLWKIFFLIFTQANYVGGAKVAGLWEKQPGYLQAEHGFLSCLGGVWAHMDTVMRNEPSD